MREMHRPNPIIAYTTALAFLLTACSVKIEPTDLSAITVESDRTALEKTLGKPDELVETQSFALASYSYNKGFYDGGGGGGFGSGSGGGSGGYTVIILLVILAMYLPIEYAVRRSKASARQKGHLVAIFDGDDKLLFASVLGQPDAKIKTLEELAAAYKASQTDDAAALLNLRHIALISEHDNRLYKRWYEVRKQQAEAGDAEAQHEIAILATEYVDKISWSRKAAAQGHKQAQTDLGTLLLYGPSNLVDRSEAKVWFTNAANAGDSYAKTELAKLSEFETNLAGSEREEPEAQFSLGNAYAGGKAVRTDQTQAVNWWHKAAENGYPPAQLKLASIYFFGDGVKADIVTATEWARKAAEHNDRETVVQLANLYRVGLRPKNKIGEAVKMFERAAALGDRSALYDLGTIYKNGEGVRHNNVQAYKWYYLAASQNDQTSVFLRDLLAKDMSPTQITEAERMAREWLKAHPQ